MIRSSSQGIHVFLKTTATFRSTRNSLRYHSESSYNGNTKVLNIKAPSQTYFEDDQLKDPVDGDDLILPFQKRRYGENFGQVVRSDELRRNNELIDDGEKYVKYSTDDETFDGSPFRTSDGSYIKGNNSEEARLHDLTLRGRVDRNVTKLPPAIATTINNNILRLAVPDRLRERAASVYQNLSQDQIQRDPETALDCDAHIGALFLQDYSHCHHVLLELQKRVGEDKFNPKRILDIGYGPATGMVALNEILGDSFLPDTKDAYIVGRNNTEMKKRAKIILSRQLNENMVEGMESEINRGSNVEDEAQEENVTETEENVKHLEDEYVGPVRTSDIKIQTKLRDTLPVTKKYDLIIVNNSLLTREYSFPRDVDENIHLILKLLSPGGHLVLVERGNTLGFETIARARQLMIRPESYDSEVGKIPRPYIKGSTFKPQKRRTEIASEAKNNLEDLEQDIINRYGIVNEDDLKFEFEDDKDFELSTPSSSKQNDGIDYHLKVLAPCPHHNRCPLQLGDPKYYKISSHKHRLNFCSFSKTAERPRYTLELKKGRRLATNWDKSSEDGFGLEKLSKKQLKKLEGTGRPGGKNTEKGSFSYLIMERALNDSTTVKRIEEQREFNKTDIKQESDPLSWPRVVGNLSKIKNNVKLNVCSPSGNIETWQIPKSLGKQVYHDAKKVSHGDLWALGKKSVIVKNRVSDDVIRKLDSLSKTQKKSYLKEKRKKQTKKLVSSSEEAFEDDDILSLVDTLATNMESSKKYKAKGKRAGFDVDPKKFDGK
ncbi:uncharacterized protein PRCAT00004370001 [Priceomyces carsonii]|uniref:uncharacterized protein n=1 Tax=Priceomyces carsonii TaxID=28549 RepID=UPI002ED977E5|nr:unnamed protein product [Priceomyces carsonii]